MWRRLGSAIVSVAVAVTVVVVPISQASALSSCNSYSLIYISTAGDYLKIPSVGFETDNLSCVLGVGNQGSAVRTLQATLNASYGAGLTVDGIYGTQTREAVRDVQEIKGLTQDGVYGPQTCSKMKWPFVNTPNAFKNGYPCS